MGNNIKKDIHQHHYIPHNAFRHYIAQQQQPGTNESLCASCCGPCRANIKRTNLYNPSQSIGSLLLFFQKLLRQSAAAVLQILPPCHMHGALYNSRWICRLYFSYSDYVVELFGMACCCNNNEKRKKNFTTFMERSKDKKTKRIKMHFRLTVLLRRS